LKKKKNLKSFIDRALAPLSRFLAACGIGPNLVTLAGVFVTLMVPVELLQEKWIGAGLWLLGAGFFDVLDGALARNSGLKRPFGAFWDSTLDRISEAIVFGGFLLYYGRHQNPEALLLAFSVCILSFLVSYTRARAEGLGLDCEVGILPRPGRVILLALGLFVSQPIWALAVVGVLSLVTVAQRVHLVWVKTGKSR
jgi:CDP-diacylglycerol---glycerol-3-phosphate 3-phosphatidyltransferase